MMIPPPPPSTNLILFFSSAFLGLASVLVAASTPTSAPPPLSQLVIPPSTLLPTPDQLLHCPPSSPSSPSSSSVPDDSAQTCRQQFVRNMTASAWAAWWKASKQKMNSTTTTISSSTSEEEADHQLLGLSFLSSLSVMNLTGQFLQARAWVRDELRLDQVETKNRTRSLIAYIGHLMSAYALEKDTLFLRKATEVARLLEPAFFSEHIAADIAASGGVHNASYSFYDLTHPELTYLANILGPSSAFAAYVTEFQDSLKRLARPVKLLSLQSQPTTNDSSSLTQSLPVVLLFTKSESSAHRAGNRTSSPRLVDILRDFYYNLLRLYVQSDGYDVQSLEAYSLALDLYEWRRTSTSENRLFSHSPNGTYLYVKDGPSSTSQRTSGVSCSLGAMLALGQEVIREKLEKMAMEKIAFADAAGNQTTFSNGAAKEAATADNNDDAEEDDHLLAVYHNQTARHGQLAEQLTASCQAVVANTSPGLLPESWTFSAERDEILVNDEAGKKRWTSLLTPDLAESLFTLYRLTGHQQYRDWAWALVQAIEANCRTADDFYSTVQVEEEEEEGKGGSRIVQRGIIPASFFSGTLKYLFLVFSPADNLPLAQWTFNRAGNLLPVCGQNSMYSERLCRWKSRKQMHHY